MVNQLDVFRNYKTGQIFWKNIF